MQTVGEIMTREVKTLSAEATLREAAELLTLQQISGAPVVDEQGTLVGILSESDLLNEAKKRAALPRVAAFGLFMAPEESLMRIYHDGATLLVKSVMNTSVVTVTEDTPVPTAVQLLLTRKINRLPVLSDGGTLIGIVTREDLLKAVFQLS